VSQAKPGPCPACGGVPDRWDGLVEAGTVGSGVGPFYIGCTPDCGITIERATSAEAIAAWNAIRARVLREAADLCRDAQSDNCYCTSPCGDHATHVIEQAADRAERGEA
jgi:hypothetical protein